MNFNGLHLLAVILTLIAIFVVVHYVEWKRADRERRHERCVHRNMLKIGSGR